MMLAYKADASSHVPDWVDLFVSESRHVSSCARNLFPIEGAANRFLPLSKGL